MNKIQFQSVALGIILLGGMILGASAQVGIDGAPLVLLMGGGCALMLSGSLQGSFVGLLVAVVGAGLLGGALAQAGAVVPGWLSVVGMVLTTGGLAWRVLRHPY